VATPVRGPGAGTVHAVGETENEALAAAATILDTLRDRPLDVESNLPPEVLERLRTKPEDQPNVKLFRLELERAATASRSSRSNRADLAWSTEVTYLLRRAGMTVPLWVKQPGACRPPATSLPKETGRQTTGDVHVLRRFRAPYLLTPQTDGACVVIPRVLALSPKPAAHEQQRQNH
jgi:hypothetical protein